MCYSTFAAGLLVLTLVANPSAADDQVATPNDLSGASLEDLMNIRITSAERKDQRADDAAAAVHVITQDDIRRSGMTKLAELFRVVPGMQVARVNASEWAVSVRGFNGLFSDKLLVLIDGRSLYNRGFSGVFWDGLNMMVSDIERIEVIRGPGGTAWGANAVNGVINIITKSAADTQGTSVEVSAGTFERDSAAIRYGGAAGDLAYRVYSQWSDHAAGVIDAGTPANDQWNAISTGLRLDWSKGPNSVMAQGTYVHTNARPAWLSLSSFLDPPSSEGVSELYEAAGLAKWTHRGSSGSLFQLQAFRTINSRDESTLDAVERTSDVDAQYQRSLGRRHEIVAGGGYRNSDLTTGKSFTLDIPGDNVTVINGFVQDEVALTGSVSATFGSKLEHDSFAGWGLLPSASIVWRLDGTTVSRQRVWANVSRARRTPGAAYRSIRIFYGAIPGDNGVPIVFGVKGNPDYRSEELLDLQGGYRIRFGAAAAIDVAAFRGHYENSTTIENVAPVFELTPSPHVFAGFQYANLLTVNTQGFEVSGRWSPVEAWRLDASYSTVYFSPHLDPASSDPSAAAFDGNAPRHQWQLHSTAQLSPRVRVDGALYYVGALQQAEIPAYTRADARLEFKITKELSAIAVGQNLLQSSHAEFSGAFTGVVTSRVPRSARFQLRWQF
jgi:iron complex outermembrane receptor protein